MKKSISLACVVVANRDQISAELEGETVVLHLPSGTYFGLNPVGSSVWRLLGRPRSVRQIQEALLEEFDVEPPPCQRDLLVFLNQLWSERLIDVRDGLPA